MCVDVADESLIDWDILTVDATITIISNSMLNTVIRAMPLSVFVRDFFMVVLLCWLGYWRLILPFAVAG
jgi:hypothetical protein